MNFAIHQVQVHTQLSRPKLTTVQRYVGFAQYEILIEVSLNYFIYRFGIFLMILGEVGNFSAYGFAPASLVAPLGTTTVIGKKK